MLPGLLSVAAIILIATNLACEPKGSQAIFVGNQQDNSRQDSSNEAVDSTNGGDEANDGSSPADSSSSQPSDDESAADDKQPTPKFVPSPSSALLAKAIGCTVRLRGRDFDGSGAIMGRDNDGYLYILTVEHASRENIREVDVFSVTTFPKPAATFSNPEVLSTSPRTDLALLRVRMDRKVELEPCKLVENASNVNNPKYAYSSGCSEGQPPTVLGERITGSGRYRIEDSNESAWMWEVEKPQKKGRSGGPLLDRDGYLIGIARGKQETETETAGYYAHSKEIAGYFIDSRQRGLITWGELGNREIGN